MESNIKSTVKNVFDRYGVPESIWLPIMKTESGGNPFSSALTSKEFSKGLFQINVKAHPQYANTNLYDPLTNAEIAAKVFIAPAYEYAKTVTDDVEQQALIVYSGLKNPSNPEQGYVPAGGIRPKWTDSTRDRFLGNFNDTVSSSESVSRNTMPVSVSGSSTSTDLSFVQNIAKLVLILLVSVVGLVAVFSLLKDTAGGKTVVNITKTAARAGAAVATKGKSEIAASINDGAGITNL
ncbi:MAG TPA: hypothetical protein DIW31_08615 [Bacteroidales bacterium]|nr:hypothetical protein [Bacteroidales bacterium]